MSKKPNVSDIIVTKDTFHIRFSKYLLRNFGLVENMDIKAEYIFYVIGIVFVFATISYFSYEYLFDLPDIVKAVILFSASVLFFFAADFLAERGI